MLVKAPRSNTSGAGECFALRDESTLVNLTFWALESNVNPLMADSRLVDLG